jgi:hypothetical protein
MAQLSREPFYDPPLRFEPRSAMACRYGPECLTGILGCDCVKAQKEAEEKAADEKPEPDDDSDPWYYCEFDDDPDLWNKGDREPF